MVGRSTDFMFFVRVEINLPVRTEMMGNGNRTFGGGGNLSIISIYTIAQDRYLIIDNTPGTAGGPGGRDRTLAVKSRKTPQNLFVFLEKKYKYKT